MNTPMAEEERNVEIMRRWFDGGVYGAPSTEAGDAYIDEHYQSVESYLEHALGMGAPELAELRRRYLE